jgi:hypothetical protein
VRFTALGAKSFRALLSLAESAVLPLFKIDALHIVLGKLVEALGGFLNVLLVGCNLLFVRSDFLPIGCDLYLVCLNILGYLCTEFRGC